MECRPPPPIDLRPALFRRGAMDARLLGISLARRSARLGAMLMRLLISLSPSVLTRRDILGASLQEVCAHRHRR